MCRILVLLASFSSEQRAHVIHQLRSHSLKGPIATGTTLAFGYLPAFLCAFRYPHSPQLSVGFPFPYCILIPAVMSWTVSQASLHSRHLGSSLV